MKASEIYTGNYLAVKRFSESPVPYTIAEVGVEGDKFARDKDQLVIWIKVDKGAAKIRVNTSNAGELSKVFGDDIDRWAGRKITLHRRKARIRGEDGWEGVITPIAGKAAKKPAKAKE